MDYDKAMHAMDDMIERDYPEDSPEAIAMDALGTAIRTHEDDNWPIENPTPVEAIRFRMEEGGLKQKDLIQFIGSKSRVSEVLSGKRSLSLTMIKRLHKGLGIPLEVLCGGAE